MLRSVRPTLTALRNGLWFIPITIVAAYGVLAVVLVEVDEQAGPSGTPLFEGDGRAAQTVLSVIAGSLITVAGLTFSITIVALQLTSGQFSPRILRGFFSDRLTQITVGASVGIFVYALLVLRSVGAGADFVPRLSVTVAVAFAVAAVGLLIAFIHHVSQRIQVSHLAAEIGRTTLARIDVLLPDAATDVQLPPVDAESVIASWNVVPPGLVLPRRPGYVQTIDLGALVASLGRDVRRAVVLVRPGDFVSVEEPCVAIWPAAEVATCASGVQRACRIASERDLRDDLDFGLRQLTDTGVRAMSPSINDPTTALTCIGYIRSIVASIAPRLEPEPVRHDPERDLTLVVRQRRFDEYLDALAEIGRHATRDPRVIAGILDALLSISETATAAGLGTRSRTAASVADAVGMPAIAAADAPSDRALLTARLDAVRRHAGG